MRCPKCGYISFDHLETCNKCSKDLTGVVEKFGGGLVCAEAPQFLVMTSQDAGASGVDSFQGEEQGFEEEFFDEDLDVLLADDAEDEDVPVISLSDDEEDADESDDGDIDFDFSFDGEEEGEVALDEDDSSQVVEEELTLSVPPELSDMSDLVQDEDDGFEFSLEDDFDEAPDVVADDDAGSFDLEELNLELDSVLVETEGWGQKEEIELSLNDIEFSELGQTGGAPALNPDGSVDMDADLDFELDLGGLSLHKKEEKV